MPTTHPNHANRPALELPASGPTSATDQIARLVELRQLIAAAQEHAGARELDARLLRLQIASDLRRSGCTKTDAEMLAKADARYVAHERETLSLDGERARWEAEAEALTFYLTAQRHAATLVLTDHLAVVTLIAPWWAPATPVEQEWLVAGALRLARLARKASGANVIDADRQRPPGVEQERAEDLPF